MCLCMSEENFRFENEEKKGSYICRNARAMPVGVQLFESDGPVWSMDLPPPSPCGSAQM